MQSAVNHFRINQKAQAVKDHERRKWFIAAREQQREKEQRLDQAEDAVLDMAVAMVLADPVQVSEFHVKLGTYDEATIKALMENQALLDSVNQRIEDMLDAAHKLEDGRRVFKTIDCESVFDEHGTSVPLHVIDPEQIPNHLPKWEHLQAERQLRKTLIEERQQILEFQEKLDHARERADADDLTQDELEDLESDLEESMPETVARQMPGYERTQLPELNKAFGAASIPPAAQSAQVAPGFTPIQ